MTELDRVIIKAMSVPSAESQNKLEQCVLCSAITKASKKKILLGIKLRWFAKERHRGCFFLLRQIFHCRDAKEKEKLRGQVRKHVSDMGLEPWPAGHDSLEHTDDFIADMEYCWGLRRVMKSAEDLYQLSLDNRTPGEYATVLREQADILEKDEDA